MESATDGGHMARRQDRAWMEPLRAEARNALEGGRYASCDLPISAAGRRTGCDGSTKYTQAVASKGGGEGRRARRIGSWTGRRRVRRRVMNAMVPSYHRGPSKREMAQVITVCLTLWLSAWTWEVEKAAEVVMIATRRQYVQSRSNTTTTTTTSD
ncbi:hypothetical protein G7Z17_g3628 [Cylindrodendrum hubeiense]|uniref:Uncharacterized protein n=1 Tax=Cylindrodendrum hubeiense TaxID=595255 RepID=A0A9P5HAH2_9HYPO|nr:hypothetical protein G7Z17_g3628 [Cylindrodendrum hubeiense]